MPSRTLASSSSRTRQQAHHGAASFVPPWQAIAMLVALTLGAGIHTFPESIQPFAQYANGMVQAARAWHQAPPANSPAYLGR